MAKQKNFRTVCRGCEFQGGCYFEGRDKMVRGKCYLEALSSRLNLSQKSIIKKCNAFILKFGVDFAMLYDRDKKWWNSLSNVRRRKEVEEWLRHFGDPTKPEIQLVVAAINCHFDAWRDGEWTTCIKCGTPIKNSKQRNRLYCEDCAGYHRKTDSTKICIDCGLKYYSLHNREVRCIDCQIKHEKEKSREYSREYRARKRQALERKS